MLIRFTVSNFKAILDPIELSLIATREQQHSQRLTYIPKFQKRYLPAAILFGGNASGKSSLVEALNFMQNKVLDQDTKLKQNAAIPENETLPSTFEVDLLLDSYIYNYQFSCTREKIKEERLTKSNSRTEYILFHRQGGEIHFPDTQTKKEEKQTQTLLESLGNDTLFLNHLTDHNDYSLVYHWFKNNLVILGQETKSTQPSDDSDALLARYNKILPQLDMGILRVEEESAQTNSLVSIRQNIKGQEYPLPINNESAGTRRLMEIIRAYRAGGKDHKSTTFVIDELDRSMHSHLTRHLLEHFFCYCQEGSQDQIIATCYDLDLIDQSLFRRDEMWFFERLDQGVQLFSYAEFEEARHDMDLRKSYKEGRIGGLAKLKNFCQ